MLRHEWWHVSVGRIARISGHSWVPKWPIKRVINKIRVHAGHMWRWHNVIPIVNTIWLVECPRTDRVGARRL